MSRRLVLLFDGTWNTVETETNVSRFKDLVAPRDASGREQTCSYVKGVGVARGFKHWLGGAFGQGLSDNVKEGFKWLSNHWRDGDEIWLFGFSRGAYTARSLGGLIRNCGLLAPADGGGVTDAAIDEAYAVYRSDKVKPDDPIAVKWRADRHTRAATIHFMGVWDTVGSLGVPNVGGWFPFARGHYAFHDTDLSKIVKYAYQAFALGEHRSDFEPTKWTRPKGTLAQGESRTDWKPEQIEVEQRWFVGAHSDVGGGEKTDGAGRSPATLPDITLEWMCRKAAAAGLGFERECDLAQDAERATPNDSYGRFIHGVYRFFNKPFNRAIGGGVNETIDASVWKKWGDDAKYRPPSIEEAIKAGKVQQNSDKVQADQP